LENKFGNLGNKRQDTQLCSFKIEESMQKG